jgi:hypothetical protein
VNRRSYLTAAAGIVGALAGCLGNTAGNNPDETEPLPGRYQYGYDAGNSHYAAGLTGPTEEPSFQRVYADVPEAPLTADETLYSSRTAVGFNGDREWNAPEPVDGVPIHPALYEGSVLCVGLEPRLLWAISREDGTEQWRAEFSEAEREVEHGAR